MLSPTTNDGSAMGRGARVRAGERVIAPELAMAAWDHANSPTDRERDRTFECLGHPAAPAAGRRLRQRVREKYSRLLPSRRRCPGRRTPGRLGNVDHAGPVGATGSARTCPDPVSMQERQEGVGHAIRAVQVHGEPLFQGSPIAERRFEVVTRRENRWHRWKSAGTV